VAAALDRLEPWGTTALYDATLEAVDAIEAARGRRALILLSDGNDRYSRASATDVVDAVRRKDVLIYPIAIGEKRPEIFAELATATGARSFLVKDARQLQAALSAIGQELRFQYLLGYTPERPIAARPEWRSIRVSANRPGARVRARDGYLAR
jgi:VWFA-related protein